MAPEMKKKHNNNLLGQNKVSFTICNISMKQISINMGFFVEIII